MATINITSAAEAQVKTNIADRLPQLWQYVQPQLDLSLQYSAEQCKKFVQKNNLVAMPMLFKMYKQLRPYFLRFDAQIDGGEL